MKTITRKEQDDINMKRAAIGVAIVIIIMMVIAFTY
jgi:hypothetical protein